MIRYYRLDGQTPVPESDTLAWARWFESASRRVARDEWTDPVLGEIDVSTVFLGLDHNPFREGARQLFETMVFLTSDSHWPAGLQTRYATWPQAEAGHVKIVALVRAVCRGEVSNSDEFWRRFERQRRIDL